MPWRARFYIALVIGLGLAATGVAVTQWSAVSSPGRMALYVAATALASLVKLRLPGLEGNYSLNGVLLLAGAVHFTLPETAMAAIAGVVVQSLFRAERRPTLPQLAFNAMNEVFSIAAASLSISFLVGAGILPFRPSLLAAAAAIYFAVNTALVSGVLTLLGGGGFREVNKEWYRRSFPYYLIGAALVGILPVDGRPLDLEACAVLIPLAYIVHFFSGLADRKEEREGRGGAFDPAIPASAKAFTGAVCAMAASLVVYAIRYREPVDWIPFLSLLALAAVTAAWKVRLPGMTGTISVQYVVVLAAMAELSMIEALAIAAAGPVVQTLWRAQLRPQPVQLLFNIATMILATGAAYVACRIRLEFVLRDSLAAFLASAAVLFFFTNTLLVSVVLSLVEKEGVVSLWRRLYFWTFPVYMVGAAAAAVMVATTRSAGWLPALFILPLMGMIQYSFRFQVGSLRRAA